MSDIEIFDILSLVSELAIAFAGFTGIAALFGNVKTSDLLRMRLAALMSFAFGVLMMSLLPMALVAFSISENTTWLASCVVLASYPLISLSFISPWVFRLRRENPQLLSLPSIVLAYLFPIMGSISGIAGIFSNESRAGFLVAGLVLILPACIFLFVRIIFASGDRDVAA